MISEQVSHHVIIITTIINIWVWGVLNYCFQYIIAASISIPLWLDRSETQLALLRNSSAQDQILGQIDRNRTKRSSNRRITRVNKYIQFYIVYCFFINPIMLIYYLRYNEVYTFSTVTCCVHNIIVGTLWFEYVWDYICLRHLIFPI